MFCFMFFFLGSCGTATGRARLGNSATNASGNTAMGEKSWHWSRKWSAFLAYINCNLCFHDFADVVFVFVDWLAKQVYSINVALSW